MITLPLSSTLFPYTTLFRSIPAIAVSAQFGDSINLVGFDLTSNADPKHPHAGDRIGISLLWRSEEHTSELQSHSDLVCRLLLEKKKYQNMQRYVDLSLAPSE